MKTLNNLVLQVSQSCWMFILSAFIAFGSLIFVFSNIRDVFEPIVGAPIFDFQNDLTVEKIFIQLPNYNEAAISLYNAFVFVDLFFPFFAALVLAAAGAFAIRRLSTKWYDVMNGRSLFALFFIPTLCDWTENIFAIAVVNSYPRELTLAAAMLVFAKKGKLATLVIMQLLVWPLVAMALAKSAGQKFGLMK